jgi:hypothetical protein
VTDEDHGVRLLREGEFRRGDVVGEGGRGVLHNRDVIAVLAEAAVNPRPARAIDESTVNENNILDPG